MDKDTVFPYDDEVADPYAADDTKNPHEETAGGDDDPEADEETAEEETADPAPKKATRTTKTVKKA